MSPLLCCQTITTTRRMLMKMRTPVTAFQMTSLHWQRSVSVKRTRGEKLNLSQPACIGRRALPLLYQPLSIIHLLKNTLVFTLNVCVPSNSGRWHHRPHLWECMFLYVGIDLATPRTFPWWCFFFFFFFSCLIIIFFIVLTC